MIKRYLIWAMLVAAAVFGQEKTIKLNPPDTTRGLPVMTALSLRASVRDFDTTRISLQDLSDLLWAANGINRPEEGKRTAPSAMNAQDVDVYVFMESGGYLYRALEHQLDWVVAGDHRKLLASRQESVAKAPVICLLVSDVSRFRFGDDSQKYVWSAEDAGIVAQNMAIFCAATGLSTCPRAFMEIEKLTDLLQLKETQRLMLNLPVGYKKK